MIHVAVLGAGIMGSATALFLARRGARVSLFDRADRPFTGASRWNEGKIHLGYLYSGDSTLSTARRLLPGGLAFKPLTEDLIGCSIDGAVSPTDETYLVHRQSVASADVAAAYYDAVSVLVAGHPAATEYLRPVATARSVRLTRRELDADYDTAEIVAGFRVPERSISTPWLADRFVDALEADARIELRMGTHVQGVRRTDDSLESPLFVETSGRPDGPFDVVVNALWEGRLAVDVTMGLQLPRTWSHRYRVSAFVRSARASSVPSTVVATGPFGDVKNYNGRDLYLSWYTAGLLAEGHAIAPPDEVVLDDRARAGVVNDIATRLGAIVRGIAELRPSLETVTVAGGWVYAAGDGSLLDPASTLHRRDRVGVTRSGSYISVDTGKYSIAPWLAQEVAAMIG